VTFFDPRKNNGTLQMALHNNCRILTLGLLLGFAVPVVDAADRTSADTYRIIFDSEKPKTARVEAEITISEQTLRMASWGHPHLPQGWATFIRNLQVTDRHGMPISFEDAGDDTWGAWKVDAEDGMRLKLIYETEFSQDKYDWNDAGGQDSRPSLSNGALFLVTKALFIYSPSVTTAEVEIVIPDNWTISSPWPAVEGFRNKFAVDSWISLVNNALVVGEHRQRVISDGDMTIVLALDERLSASLDIFEQTFRKQLGAYRKLFGGTPESRYLVTIRVADEDDGESFENSFNQVITPGRLDQRVIVWANTMGHELFHYWNGNHVLVAAEKQNVEWFGEGFTEYYSSLTLYRTGLIDENLWFRKLETYLARHVITTTMWPVDTVSLVDAGQDKHKNWLRIYGGGATMALVLDIEIRSATRGDRGLDDVMRLLKQHFSDSGARYRISDILAAVNSVSGKDFTTFFAAHITGSKGRLDIAGILRKAGINTEQFADELYLSRMKSPSPLQDKIYSGITFIDGISSPRKESLTKAN
jgi:predicted metalloprotease with PDZ domain